MWNSYIKIRGYDGTASGADPGTFEVFQGIGGSSLGIGDEWDVDEDDEQYLIIQALWQAQADIISCQSDTLAALADHLGDSQTKGGFWGIIDAIFRPVLEQIIEQIIAEAIEHAWGIPDDLAELISSFFVGLWEGVLEALDEFDQGHKQCNALVAENTGILSLEMSYANYQLRADVIQQHEESIARLSSNIQKGSSSIWQALDALLKFAGLFTGGGDSGSDDNDDWKDIFSQMETAITDLDTWMADVYTADAADPQLPVPVPPQLPTLPDKNKGQPTKAIGFYLAKIALKLFTEWLRRHKEHDPDTAEALEKAFFFIDKDGKKKSILERGLLKSYPAEILSLLEVLDQDVALRDATIDFGAFRITVKGKTIQYG